MLLVIKMLRRKSRKLASVTVHLPAPVVEFLDDLAEEVDTSRTDVVEELLRYALQHVDEIFPLEEESEEEEDEEEEEESEED